MAETTLYYQKKDITYKSIKIKDYMNRLIHENNNNNQRCKCCPYGYHVNIDVVQFAKDISNSPNQSQKIRRYQRKLERSQNNMLNNSAEATENPAETLAIKIDSKTESICSSPENNSSSTNTIDLDSQIIFDSNQNHSKSIDENIFQLPSSSAQVNLNNSNSKPKRLSGIKSSDIENTCNPISSSPKSFLISFEHLMSIREQMSASLKRVQKLELESENNLELRENYEKLLQENRELQSKLAQEKEINNNILNNKNKEKNAENTENLENISDLKSIIVPNIERKIDFKLPTIIESERLENCMKSQFTQTDTKPNLICDNFSCLEHSNNEISTESQIDNRNPKVQRRNFGVTVKPTNHHVSQQISILSQDSIEPDKSMSEFYSWIALCKEDIDRKIANVLYNVVGFFFKLKYQNAVDLLKDKLLMSSFDYKVCQSTHCQTEMGISANKSIQVISLEHSHHKAIQVQSVKFNKGTNTREFSIKDSETETEKIVFNNLMSQTIDHDLVDVATQAHLYKPSKDFNGQFQVEAVKFNKGTNTREFFFKDKEMETEKIVFNNLMSQTIDHDLVDVATQAHVNKPSKDFNGQFQVEAVKFNKETNTREFFFKDCEMETEKTVFNNLMSQTIDHDLVDVATQAHLNYPSKDFLCQFGHGNIMNNISSNTDENIIENLISERIEKSIDLLQKELKMEFKLKSQEKELVHSLETNEKDFEYLKNSFEMQREMDIKVVKKFYSGLERKKSVISTNKETSDICTEYNAAIRNAHISRNIREYSNKNLECTKIEHIDLTDERFQNINNNMNQSISFPLVVHTDLGNNSTLVEDNSNLEENKFKGEFFPADNLPLGYYTINQFDERVELNKGNIGIVTETENFHSKINENIVLTTRSILNQARDTNTEPELLDNVNEACSLVAVWMNDSTTTNTKDLNRSLEIIREFWFGLCKSNTTNLKFYIDSFKTFNSTLHERIINMVDPNGNTCLHYAISEGRWSIVRQILETEQVDTSRTNKVGYTVLMLAAVSDILDEGVLKLLISKSTVDQRSANDAKKTALMIAASRGKTMLVQWLLEAGSSVNLTDSDGSSALMCACDNGHLEVVRLFLSRIDIDTELVDNTGSNAMKIALDNSHKEIALLIFARNNLHKGSFRSKRRSNSSSQPTSPLSPRKFK